MRMNELLKTRFVNLLVEPSQKVSNEEMQRTYGEFVKHVEAVSRSDDKPTIFRMLNLTRIEITHLEALSRHEQGKKCA
jgi:hypothetical protein